MYNNFLFKTNLCQFPYWRSVVSFRHSTILCHSSTNNFLDVTKGILTNYLASNFVSLLIKSLWPTTTSEVSTNSDIKHCYWCFIILFLLKCWRNQLYAIKWNTIYCGAKHYGFYFYFRNEFYFKMYFIYFQNKKKIKTRIMFKLW